MNAGRVVVVGAGLAGAATAWALTRRGHPVTVVERSVPANAQGSSHGSARILRYAYPTQFYTDLVIRARTAWDELEADSGSQLITPAGALDFGARRDPRALAQVLARTGVAHELMPAGAARERWPGIAFDSDVLWHPGAGVIDAERAVQVMLAAAGTLGAQLRTGWAVRAVDVRGPEVLVHGPGDEVLPARHVVVSAGGWLPELLPVLPLPDELRAALPPLCVRQEQVFHVPYRSGDAAGWPTLIHKTAEMQVYGLPGGRDVQDRAFKVALFNGGRVVASASAADGRIDPAGRAVLTDYVRRMLPGLLAEPFADATCLFTSTPSEDFVIDGTDRLTVLSPCSGHGAKFAPLIGRLAADRVGGGSVPARFRVRA